MHFVKLLVSTNNKRVLCCLLLAACSTINTIAQANDNNEPQSIELLACSETSQPCATKQVYVRSDQFTKRLAALAAAHPDLATKMEAEEPPTSNYVDWGFAEFMQTYPLIYAGLKANHPQLVANYEQLSKAGIDDDVATWQTPVGTAAVALLQVSTTIYGRKLDSAEPNKRHTFQLDILPSLETAPCGAPDFSYVPVVGFDNGDILLNTTQGPVALQSSPDIDFYMDYDDQLLVCNADNNTVIGFWALPRDNIFNISQYRWDGSAIYWLAEDLTNPSNAQAVKVSPNGLLESVALANVPPATPDEHLTGGPISLHALSPIGGECAAMLNRYLDEQKSFHYIHDHRHNQYLVARMNPAC